VTVTTIEKRERRWIAFVGVIVEFDAENAGEAALAGIAREAFLNRALNGEPIEEWDVGVTDIQLHPAEEI